jgi:hypothetical protein
VTDNKDAIARRIASTAGQLEEVEEALRDWKPDNKEGNPWMNHFKECVFHSANDTEHMAIQLFSTLEEELRKLEEVSGESNFRKFLDHEDVQKRIEDIFVCINEARVRFEVCMMIFCSSTTSQCHFYVACTAGTGLQGGVRGGQSCKGT